MYSHFPSLSIRECSKALELYKDEKRSVVVLFHFNLLFWDKILREAGVGFEPISKMIHFSFMKFHTDIMELTLEGSKISLDILNICITDVDFITDDHV